MKSLSGNFFFGDYQQDFVTLWIYLNEIQQKILMQILAIEKYSFFFELNFDIKTYQQNTKGCLNSDNVKIPSKVKVITLHCTSQYNIFDYGNKFRKYN